MNPQFHARAHRVIAVAVQLAIAAPLGACSIVFPLRAHHVNAAYPLGEMPKSRLLELPGEPRLHIVTRSGERISGRFKELDLVADSAYSVRYEAWRADRDLPAIGERVRLVSRVGTSPRGPFLGFGSQSAIVRSGELAEGIVPFGNLRGLSRADGQWLDVDSLHALAAEPEMPSRLLARISWSRPEGTTGPRKVPRDIPLDDIATLRLESHVSNTGAAVVAGLVVDGLLVYALASAARDAGDGCAYVLLPYALGTRAAPDSAGP